MRVLAFKACNPNHKHSSPLPQFDISYDAFVRTTDPGHEALVAALLSRVAASGDVYKADYEAMLPDAGILLILEMRSMRRTKRNQFAQGYYCVGCEKYMDESEMDADKNCPIHRTPCSLRHEENHFFRLSRHVSLFHSAGR